MIVIVTRPSYVPVIRKAGERDVFATCALNSAFYSNMPEVQVPGCTRLLKLINYDHCPW